MRAVKYVRRVSCVSYEVCDLCVVYGVICEVCEL